MQRILADAMAGGVSGTLENRWNGDTFFTRDVANAANPVFIGVFAERLDSFARRVAIPKKPNASVSKLCNPNGAKADPNGVVSKTT